LRIGSAFHAGIAAILQSPEPDKVEIESALKVGVEAIGGAEALTENDYLVVTCLLTAWKQFSLPKFPQETEDGKKIIYRCEVPFEIPFDFEEGREEAIKRFTLKGYIDGLAYEVSEERAEPKPIFFIEHKTRSVQGQWIDLMDLSKFLQVQIYSYLTGLDKVLYDCIVKPRVTKNLTPESFCDKVDESPGDFIFCGLSNCNDKGISNVRDIARLVWQCFETGKWPMYNTDCTSVWGVCPYRELCVQEGLDLTCYGNEPDLNQMREDLPALLRASFVFEERRA